MSLVVMHLLLLLELLCCGGLAGLQKQVSQDDAPSRVNQALDGLMNYYWNKDSANDKIGFFFSCGQIGGNGEDWKRCSCSNDASCINCYHWWDAVSVESLATYGLYTNTTNHSDVPEVVFDHSPYNANWDGVNFFTFVDDFAWFGIAYLRVFEWLKVSKYFQMYDYQRTMTHFLLCN